MMDDALKRKRWHELAEKASTEDDPTRLMKLVEELLVELNRLREEKCGSTSRPV